MSAPLPQLTPASRKDLRRQIEMRERMLMRPGLERDERLTISREYCEFRALEEAHV